MPRIFYGFFHCNPLMKAGIIHNNDTVGRQLRDQVFSDPAAKYLCVYVCCKQANSQQSTHKQDSNYIRSALGTPVMSAKTTLSFNRITIETRHVMGESRFINKHKWMTFFRMFLHLFAESKAFFLGCFWMLQSFFYR